MKPPRLQNHQHVDDGSQHPRKKERNEKEEEQGYQKTTQSFKLLY